VIQVVAITRDRFYLHNDDKYDYNNNITIIIIAVVVVVVVVAVVEINSHTFL